MKQNEFNEIHVTNTKENFRFEYTPVQKTEYSEKDEYKFEGQNEVVQEKTSNDAPLTDSAKKKVEETGLSQSDLEQNVVQSTSAGSSASSVTTTSASAATSSVATAASVIAVASVSVVAGVSVIQNQNAKCSFNDLRIFTDRIEYALVLEDAGTDNFVIEVSSNTYENKKALVNGSNEGEFIGLNQGETYRILVQEDIYGGKTLFDEEFTTSDVEKEPVYTSEFTKFEVDPVFDWDNWKFSISLDFHDEDNIFDNFQLSIKDLTQEAMMSDEPVASDGNIKFEYIYDLAKTTEIQSFELPTEDEETAYFISPEDSLEFVVSAERLGVRETLQTITNFKFNPQPIVVGFNGFSSTYRVNSQNQLPVTLDIDSPEYFKDITLELQTVARRSNNDDQITLEIPLEASSGEQLVDVSEYISYFESFTFKASVKYSQQNLDTLEFEEKSFAGDSQSISFVIDDAVTDFYSTFELDADLFFTGRIYYRGEFESFILHFKDMSENSDCYGVVFEVPIDAQTEMITIGIASALDDADERLREVIYDDVFQFYISDGNNEETLWSSESPIQFAQPIPQIFEVFNVKFDKTLYKESSDSVMARIFNFGVSYADPNEEVDHFELRLVDLGQSSDEWECDYTYTLPADTDTHALSLDDFTVTQVGNEEKYRYELVMVDINGVKSEILLEEEFYFTEYTPSDYVSGFTSQYSVDENHEFSGTLDFENEGGTFTNLSIVFIDNNENSDIYKQEFSFELQLTKNEQYFDLDGVNLGNYSIFDYLADDSFIVYIMNNSTAETLWSSQEDITFDYVPDPVDDKIDGFSSDFYLDENLELVGRVLISGENGTFTDKNLTLVFVDHSDDSNLKEYSFPIDNTSFNEDSSYYFGQYDVYLDDLVDKEFDVAIKVDGITFWSYYETNNYTFFKFNENAVQEDEGTFNSFNLINTTINNCYLEGQLDYDDTGSYFQNFRMVLYPQDPNLSGYAPEIDLVKTTSAQQIDMYSNIPQVITDAYGNSAFEIAIIADTPEGIKTEVWRSDTSIEFTVEGNAQPSEFTGIQTNNHWIDETNNTWELTLTYDDHQNIYQSLTVVIYDQDSGAERFRYENVSIVTGLVEMDATDVEALTDGTLYNVEFYIVTTNNPGGELLSDFTEIGVAFSK